MLETVAYIAVPAFLAIVLALAMPSMAHAIGMRVGRFVAVDTLSATRTILLAATVLMVGIGGFLGWTAYRKSDDYNAAAERIDEKIHAHEQVVTLATLSDPEHPKESEQARTPLFPILWRNVSSALARFDPRREFVPSFGQPLKISSLYGVALAIVTAVAVMALAEPPTPLQQTAIDLAKLADKLEKEATTADDKALAKAVRKTAEDLANPELPPELKQKQLNALKQEMEKKEPPKTSDHNRGSSGGGAGSGSGKGNKESSGASSNATGQSKGEGKGAGEGKGEAQNKPGSGSGGQNKQGDKNKASSVELSKDISKAETLVETEGNSEKKSGNQPSPNGSNGNAPKPGDNPNQLGGGSQPDKNGPAPIPMPDQNANREMPGGSASKGTKGGSMGDTHLGEFPTAANYQRYLKPGEKGPGLDIKDARYVTFRIPQTVVASGAGKLTPDAERPGATVPYTNAPLKAAPDNAPPDERQLVPPRYRELIH